jgi:hypothetical protein
MKDITIRGVRKVTCMTVGDLISRLANLNLNDPVMICCDSEGNYYGTVYCVTEETTQGGTNCVTIHPGMTFRPEEA